MTGPELDPLQRTLLLSIAAASDYRQRHEGERLEAQLLRLFSQCCGVAAKAGPLSEGVRRQLQEHGQQLGLHAQQARVVVMLTTDLVEEQAAQ